ncbi:MAG TPA: AAA family ATPase [Vicinamibacterales bacterium]
MQAFGGTARFELRRRLGRGGFGIVYEAFDRERAMLLALKLLHVDDPAALYRFKREFRTIADLAHPNVVALHELFTEGDHWFFTMERVTGRPFADCIRGVPAGEAAAEPTSGDVSGRSSVWTQVSRIYHQALGRSDDERMAFVKEACAGDEVLRWEVQSLLGQPEGSDALLERLAVAVVDDIIEDVNASGRIGQEASQVPSHGFAGTGSDEFPEPPGPTMEPPTVVESRLRVALGQLVDALAAIHRVGIVHRDLKPSNVLVTDQGRVVVLDFGMAVDLVAAAKGPSAGGGTPAYMAPEQALGASVSAASDWYSVGVMLYEALTGRLPFAGTPLEILYAKQGPPPRPPDGVMAPELMALSLSLLDPDPTRRPGLSEVMRCIKHHPIAVSGAITPAAHGTATSGAETAPPLIGRDRHLQALAAAFDATSAGQLVAVFMSGPSGVGKSALLRQFLEDLRRRPAPPIICAGRCHDRESLPYKAVDGVIDDLARFLRRLPTVEAARLLPRDTALLARLFPVLLRVPEVERAQARTPVPHDAIEVRRRATTALRNLLAAIADRAPLVLAVDDLQWGDLDSALLFQEIMRPPDPPALLLLTAYRSQDADVPWIRTLRDSLMSDAVRGDVRTLQVHELTLEEAEALARRELAARPDLPPDCAAGIARESRGNSFFVHQLVQHTLTVGGPARLDTVVRERMNSLDVEAQRLLTAVALSAQPLTAVVAAAAAGVEHDVHASLHTLRARRLVRFRGTAPAHEIETYHDRIHEAIAGALDTAARRGWHARLAAAWEGSGGARPETLFTHWYNAGNIPRTVHYGAVAGEAAEQALAFERAADYYRVLLDVDQSDRRWTWRVRLGDAMAQAGRGHEAASAYLAALDAADPGLQLDLERRAAEQLIRSGYMKQARTVVASLLTKIGIRPPRTEAGALAGLLARRLLLDIRGTGYSERAEDEIARDDLQRIDALWSIGAPLSLVELIRGNNLNARGLWLALRAGEPKRLVRALTTLACSSALTGARADARTTRLLNEAQQLAERIADRTSTARVVLAQGICHKVNGRWFLARECLERALAQLTPCPGVRWEMETGRTLLHDTLFWTGDWSDLFKQLPARGQEAEERGDLYGATHVAVRLAPLAHLAADQPDRARVDVAAGMARWPSRRFDLQHRQQICSLLEADLYERRAADAWRRLSDAWPRLRWMLLLFQNARIEMLFYRARVALALVAAGEVAYLARAARDAARLEREGAAWANALARLVRASLSAARGPGDQALLELEAAERALRDSAMAHYAAAAQYRRGALLGGDQGRPLQQSALAWFAGQNVVNAPRLADMLTPGAWSTSKQE